jgi:hypothetical protein
MLIEADVARKPRGLRKVPACPKRQVAVVALMMDAVRFRPLDKIASHRGMRIKA